MKKIVFLVLFLCNSSLSMMTKLSTKYRAHNPSQNGIRSYQDKYKQKVMDIALREVPKLSSVVPGQHNGQNYQDLLHYDIMPVFNNKKIEAKLYVESGVPVGFITYRIYDPWYGSLIPYYSMGPNAEIHHLVIEMGYRNKGYGKRLMDYALTDCKNKSVNRVTLWTTAPGFHELEQFYQKFGFMIVRRTKLLEQKYALRLKRHPIVGFAKSILYGWQK
ncbi:GNAT family N-acetyltransferase [Candidatus Dependentiae bacterium]|nr:GNAT family N-acetyltransferase [Candidatus Dependentiae bacterium]